MKDMQEKMQYLTTDLGKDVIGIWQKYFIFQQSVYQKREKNRFEFEVLGERDNNVLLITNYILYSFSSVAYVWVWEQKLWTDHKMFVFSSI
jgi:hypothetical protein